MVKRATQLKSAETVCLNGKFVPAAEALIPVLAPGFLYGWGLFETLRSCNGRIVYFDAHLNRLRRSCKLLHLELPLPAAGLKAKVRKIVEANGHKDAAVRITLWKASAAESGSLITARAYQAFLPARYKKGFACMVSGLRQNGNSFLSRIKSANYLLYQLSYLKAREKGFDEAVILNGRGEVCEASRSNIFLVKDAELFTPALECGCLEGITRQVVFDLAKKMGIRAHQIRLRLRDLHDSDELFLTNSLMGIMPLTRLEKKRIKSGAITGLLMRQYGRLLHGSSKVKTSL